jgi:hypothetical protein
VARYVVHRPPADTPIDDTQLVLIAYCWAMHA